MGTFEAVYTNPYLSEMGRLANYWTCRVFMKRVNLTELGAMYLIYNNTYYGQVQISADDGTNIVSKQGNNIDKNMEEVLVSDVKTEDIFSFGLRVVNKNTLVGMANDKVGKDNYQNGEIKEHEYQFKIAQSSHVLLSLHITQEEKEGSADAGGPYFPPDYFKTSYSEQPSGSTITVWLSLENVDADLNFGLRFDDQR
ncbi:hypothetical protein MTO96_002252 [Rhipicephalus appendiculatus]